MSRSPPQPLISIGVLTYGNYPRLARRCLESIRQQRLADRYRLIVGGNAVGAPTARYLQSLLREGAIDQLHLSRRNLNKCPMMRRMLADIDTEFTCWFDDDSCFTDPDALAWYLRVARRSPPDTVMWGHAAECRATRDFINIPDMTVFVRSAKWYRGLTPPSWNPGGKGEFNFQGQGTGDGRWFFIAGGFWLIRTSALRALDWPDCRLIKLGDDVLLGEALRQQGWKSRNTGSRGVAINTAPRRGHPGALKLWTRAGHERGCA